MEQMEADFEIIREYMLKMTEEQEKLLALYKKFRSICIQNKFRYFAIGGTCLGSIRHKGFIPWDDDMDIAMPLADYNKFRKLCKKNPIPNVDLFDYEERKHSRISFLRFCDEGTTYVEKGESDFTEAYKGVFIDIMPLVGLPEDKHGAKKKYLKKCYWYMRLNYARRFEIKYKKSYKSKFFSIIVTPLILGKAFNYYSLKYEEHISQYQFGEMKEVFFPWRIPLIAPYRNVFPYELFEKSMLFPFEDTDIPVPKEYDTYLKMDFGNYMQLPPVEKRVGGHKGAIVDLHKSYKEYINERKV